jgi:hypothetical protein
MGGPPPDTGPNPKAIITNNDYAGAPPIPDTRRQIAEGEAPEEYRVDGGDTLYDICDQLIDEPDYWPKLWSLNPEIKNPHFIYPGMRLRFHAGDADTPPFLQVIGEDDIVPIERGGLGDKELISSNEDVSKILLDPGGVVEAVEIVEPKDLGTVAGIEGAFDFDYRQPDTNIVNLTIPAFVFSDAKEELGEVVAGTSGRLLVDRPEEIIIEAADHLNKDTTYTILRPGDSIYQEEVGDYVGERYEFVAHVRIIARINDDYASAIVTENRLGVQQGDIVVPYLSTSRQISIADNRSSTSSGEKGRAIIGFEYPTKMFGAKGSFVLMTKSGPPVNVGQNLTVFQHVNRVASSWVIDDLPDTRKAVAVVKVIDTSGAAVLGFVVSSSQEIRLGDIAGSG